VAGALVVLAMAGHPLASAENGPARLPARIRRIVLHVPGGPSYDRPERAWVFFTPRETQARWRRSFGAQWIVWIDGSLWPRHPRPGDPSSWMPPVDGPIDEASRWRLAREAEPVYSHLHLGNSDSIGIEVSHSGRTDQPFKDVQIRTLAWLLRALLVMSDGRLTAATITGHKDLDRRPAYVQPGCERPGCAVFVDEAGRPYRRRVDPPESLFRALEREGLVIPRPRGDGDAEIRRAESLSGSVRPRVAR
jgi:hypothetical protein